MYTQDPYPSTLHHTATAHLFPSVKQPLATWLDIKVVHEALPHLLNLAKPGFNVHTDRSASIYAPHLDPPHLDQLNSSPSYLALTPP